MMLVYFAAAVMTVVSMALQAHIIRGGLAPADGVMLGYWFAVAAWMLTAAALQNRRRR